MKQVLILSAVLTLASPMAQAQSGTDMKGMDMKGKDADKQKARMHKGVGTVKKVDPAAGTWFPGYALELAKNAEPPLLP